MATVLNEHNTLHWTDKTTREAIAYADLVAKYELGQLQATVDKQKLVIARLNKEVLFAKDRLTVSVYDFNVLHDRYLKTLQMSDESLLFAIGGLIAAGVFLAAFVSLWTQL